MPNEISAAKEELFSVHKLNKKILDCKLCPRLTEYIEEVGKHQTKKFTNQVYWAKPVPSFGDPKAKLLIIGLAPAAHGGNRTGRIFTGDSSGDWLVKALYEMGFANKPFSVSRNDGLRLKDAYLTAAVRCAPPNNKPNSTEISNTTHFQVHPLDLSFIAYPKRWTTDEWIAEASLKSQRSGLMRYS